MKNISVIVTVFILLFTSPVLAQDDNTPFEKGKQHGLLPIAKKGFRPQISIAPQVSYINFFDTEAKGLAYGGEIALQCPLLCTKKNYIRQQISFLYFKDSNSELSVFEVTLNPEYRFLVKPNFELAAGPSLGYLHSNAGTSETINNLFSYGLSTSATMHFGTKIFVGISARHNWTGSNLSHFQGLLKIGYKL